MARLYTTRSLYLTFRGPLIFWTALERLWTLGINKIKVSNIMKIVISALRRQFPIFKICLFLVFVLTIALFFGLARIQILCLKGLVINPFCSHITRGSCRHLEVHWILGNVGKTPKTKIQRYGNYHLWTKMTISKIMDTSIFYFVISHVPILGACKNSKIYIGGDGHQPIGHNTWAMNLSWSIFRVARS